MITDDKNDPDIGVVDEKTGMNKKYLVLSEEERAKGFVRPVRYSYVHAGLIPPKYELLDLTDEQKVRYEKFSYIKFEEYPKDQFPSLGRYWTQEDLDRVNGGCGTLTTMGTALSETYARDPHFYGATFCCGCGKHLPVAEFVWDGTNERVGS